MKCRIVLLAPVVVLLATTSVLAQAPEIDLYTMGPGQDVFSRFGHAALCARFDDPREDRCYNYGTTRFSDPVGLISDFIRGRSKFWQSTSTPMKMVSDYAGEMRTIWVQPLPLSPAQATAMWKHLEYDSLPANRYYTYHHFLENCSTRVRDLIDEHSAGGLSKPALSGPGPTYRGFSRSGFGGVPGLNAFGDILLGRRVDRTVDHYQAMFLPRYLRDGVTTGFGVMPELIEEGAYPELGEPPGTTITWLIVLLVVGAPALLAWWTARRVRLGVFASYLLTSIAGLALWATALLSDLPELSANEALLVFFPFDVLAALVPRAVGRVYAKVRVVQLVGVSLLLGVGVLVQPLWLPIVVVLIPTVVLAASDRSGKHTLDRGRESVAPARSEP